MACQTQLFNSSLIGKSAMLLAETSSARQIARSASVAANSPTWNTSAASAQRSLSNTSLGAK